MVEAPGTAPGSDGFITMAIYRHSCCQHGQYKDRGEGCEGESAESEILTRSNHHIVPP